LLRRRLLNLLTAVSLVLCFASGAAWAAARQSFRPASFTGVGRLWAVALVDGSLKALVFNRWPVEKAPVQPWHVRVRSDSTYVERHLDYEWEGPGCRIASIPARVPATDGGECQGTYTNVTLRLWLPTLLAALLPLGWLTAKVWSLRGRRGRHSPCPECGYDLRATPGRCTECGTAR
jgi:hypothetical protein